MSSNVVGNKGVYEGKTALITGGSTGIGFATAKLLVSGGARVMITGRSAAALEVAQKELGPQALAIVSDTADGASIAALGARVREGLGGLDLLFINAGIAKFLPYEAVTPAFFDEMVGINTRGAFFTVQALAPLIRRGGAIVLNTSVVDEKGIAMSTVYSASKAALRSLARTLATELLPAGIRVNAVSPGPIDTPIYAKLGLPAEARAGFETQMREGNPMKRFGHADEVARAACFLGFEATYTTGAELPVDGGLTQL